MVSHRTSLSAPLRRLRLFPLVQLLRNQQKRQRGFIWLESSPPNDDPAPLSTITTIFDSFMLSVSLHHRFLSTAENQPRLIIETSAMNLNERPLGQKIRASSKNTAHLVHAQVHLYSVGSIYLSTTCTSTLEWHYRDCKRASLCLYHFNWMTGIEFTI